MTILAAAFLLERALFPCDAYEAVAIPETVPYTDHYADTVAMETGYCYRVEGTCAVGVNRVADDLIHIWWTRLMPELGGVTWTNKTTLAWTIYDRGENGEVPAGITYEVAQGTIGNWTNAVYAVGLPWAFPSRAIQESPAPGVGWWFVVRGRNACGSGP